METWDLKGPDWKIGKKKERKNNEGEEKLSKIK
jgi:hypothetical protein